MSLQLDEETSEVNSSNSDRYEQSWSKVRHLFVPFSIYLKPVSVSCDIGGIEGVEGEGNSL